MSKRKKAKVSAAAASETQKSPFAFLEARRNWLLCLGLGVVLVGGSALWPSLFGGFVYDDAFRIRLMPEIWQDPGRVLLRPRALAYLFHLGDFALWGNNPMGFRFTNLVLHLSAAVLAGLAAEAVSGSRQVGLWCGLLFAVHPVHVEALASFVNRKDILAFIFSALCLLVWIKAPRKPLHHVLCGGFWVLGLAAKEVAVIALPLMLWAADLLLPAVRHPQLHNKRAGIIVLLGLGTAALLAVAAAFHFNLFGGETLAYLFGGELESYGGVLFQVAVSLPYQLVLLVLPMFAGYAAEYALHAPQIWLSSATLAGLVVAAAWIGLTRYFWRREPRVAFGLLWMGCMWLPLANLIPLTSFFIADRYLYVPSFGVCLLVGLALVRMRPHLQMVVAVVVLFWCGRVSYLRTQVWETEQTLWQAALDVGEETHRAHAMLGTLAYNQKDHAASAAHLKKACAIQPAHFESRLKLAVSLSEMGLLREAAPHAEIILDHMPEHPEAHRIMAMVALTRADWEAAASGFRKFLRTNQRNPETLNNLAWLLSAAPAPNIHQPEEALRFAETACRLTKRANPNFLFTLAMALLKSERFEDAMRVFDEARSKADPQTDARLLAQIESQLAALRSRLNPGENGRSP